MPEDKPQESFTVRLRGEGIDIERQIDASKLALVMSVIMGGKISDNGEIESSKDNKNTSIDRISIREFLDEVKAIKKSDQIVAIGRYMEKHEGKETFVREDIKARFQSARERLPANFPRDFSVAIGKGLIAEDHTNGGYYYVTKKGVQAVERQFEAQK